MRSPPPETDPLRWSDAREARNDGDAPTAIGAAFRREPPAVLADAALARIGRAVFAGAGQPRVSLLWLRVSVVAVLVMLASGGAVIAGRAVWPAPVRTPQRLTVPADSRATLTGRHGRRVTLAGPGTVAIDPEGAPAGTGAADLLLESGQLTVEAGGETVAVRAGDIIVRIPGDAAGEIQAPVGPTGAGVQALSGTLDVRHAGGAHASVVPQLPEGRKVGEAAPPAPNTSLAPAGGVATAGGGRGSGSVAGATPGPFPLPAAGGLSRWRGRGADEVPRPLGPSRISEARSSTAPLPTPVAPAPPPTEAALLATAFRKLRTDGDPAAALAALDANDRAFPSGWLRGEAALARAEALLALDRASEALPLLESAPGAGGALTRNVRLTRAELLARADQCGRAVEDFSDVLLGGDRDESGGRALAGRAACLLRGGHAAEARRDLARYLALFPDGASAAEARRLLGVAPRL